MSSGESKAVGQGEATRRLTIAEALREGITEEMERDERVFCIGTSIRTSLPARKKRIKK